MERLVVNYPISGTPVCAYLVPISKKKGSEERKYVMIDACMPDNLEEITHFLNEKQIKPAQIAFFFVTHSHFDNIGCLAQLRLLNPKMRIICHVNTVPRLKAGSCSDLFSKCKIRTLSTNLFYKLSQMTMDVMNFQPVSINLPSKASKDKNLQRNEEKQPKNIPKIEKIQVSDTRILEKPKKTQRIVVPPHAEEDDDDDDEERDGDDEDEENEIENGDDEVDPPIEDVNDDDEIDPSFEDESTDDTKPTTHPPPFFVDYNVDFEDDIIIAPFSIGSLGIEKNCQVFAEFGHLLCYDLEPETNIPGYAIVTPGHTDDSLSLLMKDESNFYVGGVVGEPKKITKFRIPLITKAPITETFSYWPDQITNTQELISIWKKMAFCKAEFLHNTYSSNHVLMEDFKQFVGSMFVSFFLLFECKKKLITKQKIQI